MLHKGSIALKRKNSSYTAGFAILQEELSELLGSKNILHTEELTHFDTLKFDRRRASYLLGRISAKQALSEILPVATTSMNSYAIGTGVFQFPIVQHLPYTGFQVSISHCDTIGVALAYPEAHPLGIDIEKIDAKKVEPMISMLTKNEIALAKSYLGDLPSAYTLLWTVKESLSKILKTGLMLDFRFLEIDSLTHSEGIYSGTSTLR